MSCATKKLVLLSFVLTTQICLAYPTGFGVGMSYGTANSVSADLYYQFTLHQFHLGGTMQIQDARGNPVDDPGFIIS